MQVDDGLASRLKQEEPSKQTQADQDQNHFDGLGCASLLGIALIDFFL